MAANANIRAIITAEDKASAVLSKFGSNVESTGKSVDKSLTSSYLALAAATAGAVLFGKKSLDAFNQSELATTRLETGIKNVKSATDKNVDALIAQSKALQKTTRFSDEAYVSAQGILTTFQLNQKAIEKLTPRLADMSEGLARVTGGMPDLEGNAILVAKAIGGEDVTGLTGALRRVGVIMTDTQQKLLQTGTVEERVALVTEILDQNFKGLAESAGTTTAGKMAQLGNNFNDLQEKVGQLIATALGPLLNLLNQHPIALAGVTIALGLLATAFIGVKVAAAISPIINSVTASMTALSSATGIATGSLIALSTVSLVGFAGAAVYSVYRITNALKEATDAQNNLMNALASADVSDTLTIKKLQEKATIARQTGNQAEANRLANVIRSMTARASGGPVMSGSPYMVGEKGPELFVPERSGNIVPNNKLSGNTTMNINVNVGMYAGTELEKRKIAESLFRSLKDIASAKSTTLESMMR